MRLRCMRDVFSVAHATKSRRDLPKKVLIDSIQSDTTTRILCITWSDEEMEAGMTDDGGTSTHNGTSPRPDRAFDPKPLVERLRAGGLETTQEVDLLLLWMRKEHPQAKILTDLAQFDPEIAVIRAVISLPSGAEAAGYGSALSAEGIEMVERAETKAIGRALNALGYSVESFDGRPASIERRVEPPAPVRAVAPPPELEEEEPAEVTPITSSSPRQSVPTPKDAEEVEVDSADYSWTAFWKWARPLGFANRGAVEAYIGRDFNELQPVEVRRLIREKSGEEKGRS